MTTIAKKHIIATPPHILVVDDDPLNRRVLSVMLGKLGFATDLAENAEQALHLLRQHHYSLVFMDIQMPDMDGCTATRLLRDPASGVKNHDLPVIALTALSVQGSKNDCLDARMNDFLLKPITSRQLADTLKTWLQDHQPHTVEAEVPLP